MSSKDVEKFKHTCPACRAEYPCEKLVYQCDCGSKVIVKVNLNDIEVSRKEMLSRREKDLPSIERYFEFLPLLNRKNLVHLGEGNTPLVHAKNLGRRLAMPHLYLKNEINNPTGSFKDRPINVGLNRALEFGAETVASASSGNAANSLAAGSAKANIRCVAFVPADAPRSKIAQLLLYGAEVIPVGRTEGYLGDPTVEMLTKCYQELGFHPIPSFGHLNPYQMEGAKTIGYEIAEDMVPNHMLIPLGGGGLYLGNYNAFSEYKELDIVDELPVMHAVQGAGCAPLVKAFRKNKPIETWEEPRTIAAGLADPFTWDGERVLTALKENGGLAIGVEDGPIVEAQKLLARYEGIFAEPTGSASLAGLFKLVDEGVISKDETVVVEVTGHGFKDLVQVEGLFEMPGPIRPDMKDVRKRLRI
ncbi:MAG: threonine synthase [Candidatus Thermoplasmatota archaeon]|jgi:threonine synthase|nr:threonine synthase [Candidatus Thermoplasmatota archaeon]